MISRGVVRLLVVLPLICLVPCAGAQDKSGVNDFLYHFLPGKYILLGSAPESGRVYKGKVLLEKAKGKFKVVRIIDHQKVTGTGKIETSTPDEVKVLRVRFVDHSRKYEVTYLIGSDLDNYARLTGYLYLREGKTKIPGLEALFIDPNVLVH